MSKSELDGLVWLDTAELKRRGFLSAHRTGTLSWRNEFGESRGRINVETYPITEPPYIQVSYVIGGRNYSYKLLFKTTPCHYGGLRYWLLCPLTRNQRHCGRSARKLYLSNGYFGCRVCHRLVYPSQNLSKAYRTGSYHVFEMIDKAETVLNSITVSHYNGKPTKKMKRYLRIEKQLEKVDDITQMLDTELRKGVQY